MTKGRPPVENQDYFKVGGTTSGGRRRLARERSKLAQSRKSASAPLPHPPRVEDEPPVRATGAGAETIRRALQKRAAREAHRVEEEQLDRLVDFEAPTASTRPDHMLPPARTDTAIADFWREVRDEAGATARAARELYAAVGALLKTPLRLARVLRDAFAQA